MVKVKNKKQKVVLSKTTLLFISLSALIVLTTIVIRMSFIGVERAREKSDMRMQNQVGEVPKPSLSQKQVIPDDFPKDIPIYPNSTIQNVSVNRGDEILGISIIWTSTDSFENVSNYFKKNFGQTEWSSRVAADDSKNLTLSFTKDEYSGFVGVVDKGEEVAISITVGIR